MFSRSRNDVRVSRNFVTPAQEYSRIVCNDCALFRHRASPDSFIEQLDALSELYCHLTKRGRSRNVGESKQNLRNISALTPFSYRKPAAPVCSFFLILELLRATANRERTAVSGQTPRVRSPMVPKAFPDSADAPRAITGSDRRPFQIKSKSLGLWWITHGPLVGRASCLHVLPLPGFSHAVLMGRSVVAPRSHPSCSLEPKG